MSNVFETGLPRFVGTGTPDSNGVILYYSILDASFSEKVMKMFESPVATAGTRTWKYKGRHATFSVTVHLHKYDSNPPSTGIYASAKAFVAALLTYEDQDVNFYPFYDAGAEKPIKDTAGALVTCHIVDIKFDFLERVGSLFDICTITFQTNKFYDLTKLIKT